MSTGLMWLRTRPVVRTAMNQAVKMRRIFSLADRLLCKERLCSMEFFRHTGASENFILAYV